ncbi:MAG: group I truncated hemoglobin [Sulfuriferula sp.]
MKKMSAILTGLLMVGAVQLATAADTPTLYDQLGGKPAIKKVVDDMITHVAADTRINSFFANANIPHLKMELVSQICAGTGGPCTYTGQSMQAAHKGMNIDSAQFNALVEDLQLSLADNHVPIGLGNQLLAILAPMKKDIDHK